MNAMILAAGFGTRLRPLTETIPKALVPLHGKPILELLLEQLEHFGFKHVAINAHHLANQVKAFLDSMQNQTSLRLHYSYEPTILNTGGGIKNMLAFFPKNEPILVQNVDILCSIDYGALMQHHVKMQADATLVINTNETNRSLSFSHNYRFLGRSNDHEHASPNGYNFCGIQIIQPSLFSKIDEDIFYSIDLYCQAANEHKNILGYDISGQYWRDIGTEKDLKAAEQDLSCGFLKL